MSDADDYRCFVGSLSWNTTDVDLKDAFGKFGRVTETKVIFSFHMGPECLALCGGIYA